MQLQLDTWVQVSAEVDVMAISSDSDAGVPWAFSWLPADIKAGSVPVKCY
jgi:hypothetical protein